MTDSDYHNSSLRNRKSIPTTDTVDDFKSTTTKSTDIKHAKDDCCSKGKTPDGTVFKVPKTREMVQSLFDPREPKTFFDLLTLATLFLQLALFLWLPRSTSQYFFLFLFLFWRLAYNLGLGVLLKWQSNRRGLVKLAKQHKIFENQWLTNQLSMKMNPTEYNAATAPVEYNTWLLFRQLVDLILMNDFASYVWFAAAWFNTRPQASFFMDEQLRWLGGIFLILFNIWVKLDAQRVVKDFAWYWGDFFFLIEQSLTFDGVFEMAPHPMYSVGYIGYYGISLICASYTVLFISITAHILQMAFLVLVETPHIEKIYNPPSIPKRQPIISETLDEDAAILIKSAGLSPNINLMHTRHFRRDLIVFKNFDLFQSSDLAAGLIMAYAAITPLLVKNTTYAILQAIFWRIVHSGVLGWLLFSQSKNKFITRHFVKWGGGVDEAFQNWKSIYNLSSCMTYVSFITLCLKLYTLPSDWTYGMTLLRHTLGLAFICLHIWTSVSIYEVLGDFGWFYGDFFIDDHPTQLLYTGIYRFLNNPEKIMGHAAFWGFSLITNHHIIFALALFSHIANSLFLEFVERPHMQKLYGDQIRKEAGLTKTLRTAIHQLPATNEIAKKFTRDKEARTEKVDHVADTTMTESITISSRPTMEQTIPVAKSGYSLTLSHYRTKDATTTTNDNIFILGERIKVNWTAPLDHGSKDWIGIYKVSSNPSKSLTTVSSRGKWYWANAIRQHSSASSGSEDGYSTSSSGEEDEDVFVFPPAIPLQTHGQLVFHGARLPWHVGTYEIRYHHHASHHVMACSVSFDIVAPAITENGDDNDNDDDDYDAMQLNLLRLVQSVLDHDPRKMPMSPVDDYLLDVRDAKKMTYAIKLMWGVEFAPEVVVADKRVSRLAKRVQVALQALSPFDGQKLKRRSSSQSSSVTDGEGYEIVPSTSPVKRSHLN